jgi:hypothetical protein
VRPRHLAGEPFLRAALLPGGLAAAIVLVAPVDALLERTADRAVIEEDVHPRRPYDGQLWRRVIAQTDLGSLYRRLFQLLDASGAQTAVLSSTGSFERIAREDVAAVLGPQADRPSRLRRVAARR